LTPRVRLEWLPPATFDWREARNWFWPLALLVGVIALYLMQSSFATTSELEIGRLLKERDAIMRRHAQLTVEIAEFEKPARIRARALALGLVDASKNVKLDLPATTPDHTLAALFVVSNAVSDSATLWQPWVDEFARWTQRATRQLEQMSP
jgi:hypothetical protein